MKKMGSSKKGYTIYEYMTTDGLTPVGCFINGLDSKIRKKIFKQLYILENGRNPLREPHVKSFRVEKYKGLYELRTKIKKVIRIIFYINREEEIVLLNAFTKKHERATEKALSTALFRVNALKTCISDKIPFERGD